MKKVNVIISKDGKDAVSDWEAANWYQNLLKTGEDAVVATLCMFNELRVGVRVGEIEPFSFTFEGETYSVGEDAKVNPIYPTGFFDHQAQQMFIIMTGKSREQANQSHNL